MIIKTSREYKHIELCIVAETEDSVKFYIKSQTHIRTNFAVDCMGRVFFSEKTGWYLKSVSIPEVRTYEFTLFTRGTNSSYDTQRLTVSKQVFEIIQETINEYNETFKDKELIMQDPKNFIPNNDIIYNIILENKNYDTN